MQEAHSGSTDATGTSAAKFNLPWGITTDGTNLYVAEYGNHKIRKISLFGTATADVAMHNLDDDTDVTVKLESSDTEEATVAPATLTFTEDNWNTAQAVTLTGVDDNDADGNKAYAISLSAEVDGVDHEKVNPEVTTFAGSGLRVYTARNFTSTTDGTNLYVGSGYGQKKIRKINLSTNQVSTLAGSVNGNFIEPFGMQNLISGRNNHRRQQVSYVR